MLGLAGLGLLDAQRADVGRVPLVGRAPVPGRVLGVVRRRAGCHWGRVSGPVDRRLGPLRRVVDSHGRIPDAQGRHLGVSSSEFGVDRGRGASTFAPTGGSGCAVRHHDSPSVGGFGRLLGRCIGSVARKALDGPLALGGSGEANLGGGARAGACGRLVRQTALRRRPRSHARRRVLLLAGIVRGGAALVNIPGPAAGKGIVVVLSGQAGSDG